MGSSKILVCVRYDPKRCPRRQNRPKARPPHLGPVGGLGFGTCPPTSQTVSPNSPKRLCCKTVTAGPRIIPSIPSSQYRSTNPGSSPYWYQIHYTLQNARSPNLKGVRSSSLDMFLFNKNIFIICTI